MTTTTVTADHPTTAHHGTTDHPTNDRASTTPQTRARASRWARSALARHAYAVLALPVGLVGLVLALAGRSGAAERRQRALARRFLAVPAGAEDVASRRYVRAVAHRLASVPVDLVAFALVAPAWAVFLARGVLYPVFGANNLDQSWGGPTLAGAWVVHFIQGPPLLLAVTLLLTPVSRLQARLAGRTA